jgi:hypothetical protein
MKPTLISIALASLVLVFATGCCIEHQSRLNKCLLVIENPRATLGDLNSAFAELRELPVTEKPSFWTEIVNDIRYDSDHRRNSLAALFGRHFRPGTRLNRFYEVPGTAGWFTESNLRDYTIASWLPLRNRGACVFSYTPDLLLTTNTVRYTAPGSGGVLFSIERHITRDEFVAILQGREDDGGNRIVGVAATPGFRLQTGPVGPDRNWEIHEWPEKRGR